MKGTPHNAGLLDDALALHLLDALSRIAREGRRTDTAELAREIGVRRADARRVLTTLDRMGYVDVLTLRPTLLGFALGVSAGGRLPALRRPREVTARAA